MGKLISALENPLDSYSGVFTLQDHMQSLSFDTSFSSVSLLLHGNKAIDTTVFRDSSNSNLVVTRVGNPVLSDAQYKFPSSSMYFSGLGQLLTSTNTTALQNAFEFGTGDFTIECWSYLTMQQDYQFIFNVTHTNGNLDLRYGNSGFGWKLQVGVNTNTLASTWSSAQTQSASLNTWNHLAFTRASGVNRLFFNGTLQSIGSGANPSTYPSTSFTDSTSVTGPTVLRIGGHESFYSRQFIDELRVTKGIARYTSSFTAPTSPFPSG